ncbi:hypothetical protein DFQ27_000132 [Actinomortierella ambigua]|uniref:HCP-like protein n=1 Tax=Actinomortierella ambigua TaxID=1343610 RepID=A0A9P6UA69_9FUNG|nr:hypothetical protein DFQ27_000132 [Actinomortierella ambigua]
MPLSTPSTPGSSKGKRESSHYSRLKGSSSSIRRTRRRAATAPVQTLTASSDDERDELFRPFPGRTRRPPRRRLSEAPPRPERSLDYELYKQHGQRPVRRYLGPSDTPPVTRAPATKPSTCPASIRPTAAAHHVLAYDIHGSGHGGGAPPASPQLATATTTTATATVADLREPRRTFIECRRAAERGEVQAQVELGWMYEHGFRMPRDHVRARRWYLAAADAGHAGAQFHLGMLYEEDEVERGEGEGDQDVVGGGVVVVVVEEEERGKEKKDGRNDGSGDNGGKENEPMLKEDKDKDKEEKKKTRKEEQGKEIMRQQSQHQDRPMGKDGRQHCQQQRRQNMTPAYEWYAKAAKQGLVGAQFKMGDYYDTLAHQHSPSTQLSRTLSRKHKEDSGAWNEGKDKELQRPAAIDKAGKQPTIFDDRKAVKWYRRAALQGHAEAQYRLGDMYASGRGVYRETSEAYRWLRRAADQDHQHAQAQLGRLLQQGQGIDGNGQDDVQAVAWFRRAADQGNVEAWFRLGEMYEQGRGVGQDDCKAVACYSRAKDGGHMAALKRYQSMYRRGRGVHQLPVVGPDWMRVLPNYVLGCFVTCHQIFRLVADLESEVLDSSTSSSELRW